MLSQMSRQSEFLFSHAAFVSSKLLELILNYFLEFAYIHTCVCIYDSLSNFIIANTKGTFADLLPLSMTSGSM